MSISLGAAGGLPSNADRVYLRVEEQFYNVNPITAPTSGGLQLVTGLISPAVAGNLPTILGGNALGTGGNLVLVAGRHVHRNISGAARQVRFGSGVSWPISQQFLAAGAIPVALYGRPLRQWIFEVPCRVTVAGTAKVEVGLVISNGMIDMLGTGPGAVWTSNPAVNAGRWLPRVRQVAAGAITTGADSGVVAGPTVWHTLGMRYTEGPTPTLEWLLDGAPRHILSGDANMVTATATPAEAFCLGSATDLPAGTTVEWGAAYCQVLNLG